MADAPIRRSCEAEAPKKPVDPTSSRRSSSSPATTAPTPPPTWPAACACSTRSNIRMIKLPCTGKLEVIHLLRAIEDGADGVYAAGCLEGECHYLKGNLWARKRVDHVKNLLAEVGLEPERVEMYNMSSAMGAKFAELRPPSSPSASGSSAPTRPSAPASARTPPPAQRSAASPWPTKGSRPLQPPPRKERDHDHR